jgi:hypothetical protein
LVEGVPALKRAQFLQIVLFLDTCIHRSSSLRAFNSCESTDVEFGFFPSSNLNTPLPGSADLLLVNSSFTAAIFNQTFRRLRKKGVKPTVLYPAVDLKQFDIPPPSPKEQEGTLEDSIMVEDTLEGIGGLHRKS